MKQILLTKFLLIIITLQGYSQLLKEWEKNFSTAYSDKVSHMEQDSSGVYLFLGGNINAPMGVAKYSHSGVQQWITYVDINPVSLYKPSRNVNICINNNSIYILGYRNVLGDTTVTEVLAKLNAITGALTWKQIHSLGSTDKRVPQSMAISKTGEIYIGYMFVTIPDYDWMLSKYKDKDGTLEWSTPRFDNGSHGDDWLTKVKVDQYGNPFVLGTIFDRTGPNYLIVKYNSAGTLQWLRSTYKGFLRDADIDSNDFICITGDGGTVGYSTTIGWKEWEHAKQSFFVKSTSKDQYSYVHNFSIVGSLLHVFITKFDNTTGTIVWEKLLESSTKYSTNIYNMFINNRGSVYLTGKYNKDGYDQYFYTGYNSISDIELKGVELAGTLKYINAAVCTDTPNNLYIILDYMAAPYNINIRKYHLFDLAPVPSPLPIIPVATISPNPTNEGEKVSVHLTSTNNSPAKIEIHNTMGELIYVKEQATNTGENTIAIDQRLPRGMYIVTITTKENEKINTTQNRLFVK